MESFISLVTTDILKFTSGHLQEVKLIFPNRRAGVIFRKELAGKIDKTSWAPEIFSVDDWMVSLSGLLRADKLVCLAELFPFVRKHIPSIDSFEDFIDFGEILLSDFDDVDKNLSDPSMLFKGLTEYRRTEQFGAEDEDRELENLIAIFWNTFRGKTSRHQDSWLKTWESLEHIYNGYESQLIAKDMGSSGMCYRKVVQLIDDGRLNFEDTGLVGLIGFNALTLAEEKVFAHLRELGKARFYWDYHDYYCDGIHEAGKFISSNLKLFPSPESFKPFVEPAGNIFDKEKGSDRIRVIPVTSNSGQIHLLMEQLREKPSGSRSIVLPDESVLNDLIRSWSAEDGTVNFSSGYPVSSTLISGLLRIIADLQQSYLTGEESGYLDSRKVMNYYHHPLIAGLLSSGEISFVRGIPGRFSEKIPTGLLDSFPLAGTLDAILLAYNDIAGRLVGLLNFILASGIIDDPIELAAFNDLKKELERIRQIEKIFGLTLDQRSIYRLVIQFLNSHKITLETEREGINQVMGILETRLLDFDEVFILTMNEGVWPSKSLAHSMIPYSLRKFFSLPTVEHRDWVYSYHFYRLIQRAKHVTLFYLTGHRDDAISTGEKSRYITQLEMLNGIEPKKLSEPFFVIPSGQGEIIIKKEGMVCEALARYLDGNDGDKYLSPSALKDFIDCPLRFAFSKVYDFREPWEIGSAAEPKGFGTLIHNVMDRLYRPFTGKVDGPDKEWFTRILEQEGQIDGLIRQEYPKILQTNESFFAGGKDLLGLEVAAGFIRSILRIDSSILPLKIRNLETPVRLAFPLRKEEKGIRVNLGGIIDRIDESQGTTRIVDYKTGTTQLDFTDFESLKPVKNPPTSEDQEKSKKPPKSKNPPKDIFQVLLYCELVGSDQSGEVGEAGEAGGYNLAPCIYPVMDFKAGKRDFFITRNKERIIYQDIREDFSEIIHLILNDIFDKSIPFEQTRDMQKCKYCPYSGLCRRGE